MKNGRLAWFYTTVAAVPAPLLLSCKITNAALRFLEKRGEDLEPLYERFDWPLTYLRDSSSWLEADRLESILVTLDELYGRDIVGGEMTEVIGHESPQLRAWGALDSVLRIVPSARDLFYQPDRFLGSFISPQPQIRGLHRTSESTSFRIDFSDDRLPRTASYLRASLEVLPEFIGKPRATVTWFHGEIGIAWSERQVALASHTPAASRDGHSLSPDLLRTILMDLANAQRELEAAQRALKERDTMLEELRAEKREMLAEVKTEVREELRTVSRIESRRISQKVAAISHGSNERTAAALHEVLKLGDYFARAQQMVTLMRGKSAKAISAATVESLIRRTAWEQVAEEAPKAIRRAAAALNGEAEPERRSDDLEGLAPVSGDRHRPSLFDSNQPLSQ